VTDRRTDRQTTWTITLAAPHIVAGELISIVSVASFQSVLESELSKIRHFTIVERSI